MRHFITPQGHYYVGDRAHPLDTEVPSRPSTFHVWENGAWVLDLAAAQAQAWLDIQAERDRRKMAGAPASGKWFHTDTYSRTQQLGMVILGANLPANISWKTMDGTFITMTPALVSELFQSVAGNDIAIFTAAETHRAAMMAAEDPLAYDFSTGWPAVYGE